MWKGNWVLDVDGELFCVSVQSTMTLVEVTHFLILCQISPWSQYIWSDLEKDHLSTGAVSDKFWSSSTGHQPDDDLKITTMTTVTAMTTMTTKTTMTMMMVWKLSHWQWWCKVGGRDKTNPIFHRQRIPRWSLRTNLEGKLSLSHFSSQSPLSLENKILPKNLPIWGVNCNKY